MNCSGTERKILLAESGELAARDTADLDRHLAQCAPCRAYRDSLRGLTAKAAEWLPSGSPSPAVMAHIRAAAKNRQATRTLHFSHPTLQVLAYAACLTLVLGGWLLVSGREEARADRIEDMHAIMAMVADEEDAVDSGAWDETSEADLHELGRQLLIMQGLAAEDFTEDDLPVRSPEDPMPRASQSRSSPVPETRRCV